MPFEHNEVVWAQVEGFPWWPAVVVKVPKPPSEDYRINFFGEKKFAYVSGRNLAKYKDNYERHANAKGKPQKCIQEADKYIKEQRQRLKRAESFPEEVEPAKKGKSGSKLKRAVSEMQEELSSKRQEQQACQDIRTCLEYKILQVDFKKLDGIEASWRKMLCMYVEGKKKGGSTKEIMQMMKEFDFQMINDEELSKTRIPNIVKYLQNLARKNQQPSVADCFSKLFSKLQSRVLNYLTSTDYYQHFLTASYEELEEEEISKPQSTSNFEDKVFDLLKRNYHFKKDNARLVSQRLNRCLQEWINQKKSRIIRGLKGKTVELRPGRDNITEQEIEFHLKAILNE